jgi:hypothetical protein
LFQVVWLEYWEYRSGKRSGYKVLAFDGFLFGNLRENLRELQMGWHVRELVYHINGNSAYSM